MVITEFFIIDTIIRDNPKLSDKELMDLMKERSDINIKETAKGLSNVAEILAYSVATTLIDIGVATPQLLSQLRKAPLMTLVALPGAIIEGGKQDSFSR